MVALFVAVAFLPARWMPGFDEGHGREHLNDLLAQYALPPDADLKGERFEGRGECDVLSWLGMSCTDDNILERRYETQIPASQLCADIAQGVGGVPRAPDYFNPVTGGCDFWFALDDSNLILGSIRGSSGATALNITADERVA